MVDAGEQDLLAATAGQTRRVRPEYVNYAKRAKRVDVRKLKENIWKNLDIVVPPEKKEEDNEDVDMVRSFTSFSNSDCGLIFISALNRTRKQQILPKLKCSPMSSQVCRKTIRKTSWKKLALVSVSSVSCIWRTSRV